MQEDQLEVRRPAVRAGRLCAHAELDHARLLEMLAESGLIP